MGDQFATDMDNSNLSGSVRRPYSIISVSSSSSNSSSQPSSASAGPTFVTGTVNLGFEAGNSPRPLHRSVTRTSQCSAGTYIQNQTQSISHFQFFVFKVIVYLEIILIIVTTLLTLCMCTGQPVGERFSFKLPNGKEKKDTNFNGFLQNAKDIFFENYYLVADLSRRKILDETCRNVNNNLSL